jgi:hypothetical protein
MTLLYRIELRNDTSANWTASNPVLAAGEAGFEVDTNRFKIGDGTHAYNSLAYANSGGYTLNASLGTPNAITPSGGITPLHVQRELQFIIGSGGAVTITASPAIAAGTAVGQELVLHGTDNTRTVTFNTGTGVSLNGPIVMGATGAGAALSLVWDGSTWFEVSRR